MASSLPDPWSWAADERPPRPRTGARLTVAWVIAVLPFVAAVFRQGETQQRAATALAAAGALAVGAAWGRLPSAARAALAVAAAALAATEVAPTLGRTVVLLCASALVLAIAPTAQGLPRQPAGLRLLALGLVAVTWWREQLPALATAGLALAAAALVLEHRRPAIAGKADERIGRAIHRIATGASHVVIALVAIPFLYLPTLLATPVRRWRRHRQHRTGSTWTDRSIAAIDEAKEARRPFAPVPAAHRRTLNLVGLAAIVAASVLVWQELPAQRAPEPDGDRTIAVPTSAPSGPTTSEADRPSGEVPLADRPAMADAPWAAQLEEELGAYSAGIGQDQAYGNLADDYRGELVEVVDGVRSSSAPACDCPAVDVWLVGGSAAFGWHQRDASTLASAVAAVGAEQGLALDVTNVAVPGWTLADERRAVIGLLDAGAPAPDLVVFYDGFNDVVGALAEAATTGTLRPFGTTTLDPDQLTAYSREGGSIDGVGGPQGVATIAADRYRREADAATAALADRGIEAAFVLQADALASPDQLDQLRPVTGLTGDQLLATDLARTLDGFEAALDGLVVDARHAIDDVAQPIFTDLPHTNEAGARRSAEVVVAGLDARLRSLAR